MNSMIGNIEGVEMMKNDSCLIFNRIDNEWEHSAPCADALGVCKYNLGTRFENNEFTKQ